MANIQKTLDSLQPYVIGIRYQEGIPLVDALFKDGWTIIDDPKIKKIKGNDEMNYYMIFSEANDVGLDELLGYVDRVIKNNLEREKKHELLRVKVNELKEIFKKNNLSTLRTLKFSFGEEDLMPTIDEIDYDEELISDVNDSPNSSINSEQNSVNPEIYIDDNGNNLPLSDEEREILEEEARAERNRKLLAQNKKKTTIQKIAKKVELPPKNVETSLTNRTDCDCGPAEACDKCIETKDL